MKDALDEQLIALLRRNGRESISALASRLGQPRAVVRRRLTELRESGGVTISAVVNPELLGMTELCHLAIRVDGPAEPAAERIARLEAAVFVSITAGPHDVVAELRVGGRTALVEAIERIRALPGVESLSTTSYLTVHESPYSSIVQPASRRTLDAVDWNIVDVLQQDGRTSFRDVASRVGISDSAVRARVSALIDAHVMRVTAIVSRTEETRSLAAGIGLNVRGPAEDLARRLAALPEVEFLVTTVGAHDIIATVSASSLEELQRVISRVRSLPEVRRTTTWTHMSVVKELYTASLRDFVPAPPPD